MKLQVAPAAPMTNGDLLPVRQRHHGREARCGGRHQGRLAAEMPECAALSAPTPAGCTCNQAHLWCWLCAQHWCCLQDGRAVQDVRYKAQSSSTSGPHTDQCPSVCCVPHVFASVVAKGHALFISCSILQLLVRGGSCSHEGLLKFTALIVSLPCCTSGCPGLLE